MIWVVSLNSCLGHIYSYDPKQHQLNFLETFKNPTGQTKTSDLISDRPGHYQTAHAARGAYEWPTDPHEISIDHFTKGIAHSLKKSLDSQAYKQLILCAPPHVGGILLSNLNESVKHTLLVNIKKDLIESNPAVLVDYLRKHWWDIIRSNKIK